jgi:hypothetical protein
MRRSLLLVPPIVALGLVIGFAWGWHAASNYAALSAFAFAFGLLLLGALTMSGRGLATLGQRYSRWRIRQSGISAEEFARSRLRRRPPQG